MVFGFGAGSLYLYMVYTGAMEPWLGLDHLRFGIVGMAASLIAMVAVTLMTPEPDAETQAMVDEVRVPTGPAILSQTH
jgi:cation/acetate symporter